MKWHPVHEDLFVTGTGGGALHFWVVDQSDSIVEISAAHGSTVHDVDWHPVGHILVSSSHDHATKFWTRNRPGEQVVEMDEAEPIRRGVGLADRMMRKRPAFDDMGPPPSKRYAGGGHEGRYSMRV